MSRIPLTRSALLCSAIAVLAPYVSFAQSTTTKSSIIQEVVVTAARKSQSIQKTSIAVTAISGTTIQQQGETNLQQIVQNVPGVTINAQQRGFTATIRGQGTDLPPGSGQGAVATEFDGMYNIRAEGGVVGYYDLSRVEVLPGPQGTLYGVNADGGVINVISNDPVIGKYTGSVSAQIGNYHLFRGEAMVNVPAGDVLAVRVAGAAINRGAYVTPDQGDAVAQSERDKILYKPNDQISVLFGHQYDHIGGIGPSSNEEPYTGDSINNLKNPWGTGSYVDSGPSTANSHENEKANKEWVNASFNLFNIAKLNVISSYDKVHDHDQSCGASGPPGSSGGVGTCAISEDPQLLEQVSSEERLTNADGSLLQWDVGAYHWNYRQSTAGNGPTGLVGQQSDAGFGEFTYPIRTGLRLIGGVRESMDHKTSNATSGDVATFHHFDYRVGLEYDLTPQSMEYVTASTGYRPGGFNGDGTRFHTEQVTSYEIGSKNRYLDNTLQLNYDFFYYNQQNYQLLDFFTPYYYEASAYNAVSNPYSNECDVRGTTVAACSSPTFNLGAHVYGLEFQTRYNLTPDDQFNLSGSFLAAYFNQHQGTCASAAVAPEPTGCYIGGNLPTGTYDAATNPGGIHWDLLNGEVQPHAPKFSGNFSYQRTVNLANGSTITAAVQLFFSTGYFVHPIEDAYTYQPAYWTQGLNVAYNPPSATWNVNAYVRNLSNYAVKSSAVGTSSTIGEPRTFGVTGTYHF